MKSSLRVDAANAKTEGRLDRLREILSRNRFALFLAVSNLTQHRMRLVVALVGTAVPIVLLIMQMAVLDSVRIQVTRLYDYFAFDVVIVPPTYQFLFEGGTFDRVRLLQALAVPGVAESFNLNIESDAWTNPATEERSTLLVVGVDEPGNFIRDDSLRTELETLRPGRNVLVDSFSSADFGDVRPGASGNIGGQPVEVGGNFQLGLFFYTDGSAIVRNSDFANLTRRDARQTSVGLLRLADGADAEAVKAQLMRTLPPDVRVLTRNELIAQERAFFVSTKPIGIMLTLSMWIAFMVGAVILLQVISTEIVNRMNEFATLNAMGFGHLFVFGIGVLEAMILAITAFIPAFVVAAIILGIIESLTHLPTAATPLLAVTVLLIVLAMSALAAASAIRRVAHADPAELY